MLSDGKFEYIYKTSTDRVPFAQVDISTKEVTYLHSDLTGSIVATTDSAGVLIGTVDYSPYGEVIGSSLSRFGYAGEWTDEVTGYVYLRARWMDVSTGNFLSEDPLVQMTNNAFDYTEGNPLSQIDPLGLWSWNDQMSTGPIAMNFLDREDVESAWSGTKKVSKSTWDWTESNSGYISTGLGLAAIFTNGTKFSFYASGASLLFGIVSLNYEIANCDGRKSDKVCDPASIGLGVIGIGTGVVGNTMGRLGSVTNTTINLDNASFLAGILAIPTGIGVSIIDKLKKKDKEGVKCD